MANKAKQKQSPQGENLRAFSRFKDQTPAGSQAKCLRGSARSDARIAARRRNGFAERVPRHRERTVFGSNDRSYRYSSRTRGGHGPKSDPVQPLVKNAVKHGVGRSADEVEFTSMRSRSERRSICRSKTTSRRRLPPAGQDRPGPRHRPCQCRPSGEDAFSGGGVLDGRPCPADALSRVPADASENRTSRGLSSRNVLCNSRHRTPLRSPRRSPRSAAANPASEVSVSGTAAQSGTTSHLSSGLKRSMKGTISSVLGPRSRS